MNKKRMFYLFTVTTLPVILLTVTLLAVSGTILPVVASNCRQPYIVKFGDTVSGIAQRFGVSVGALAHWNHIANLNHIYVGQRLCLPGSSSMPAPPPIAAPATATPSPTATLTVTPTVLPITPTAEITESNAQLVLEATYLYSSTTIGVNKWPFAPQVGVRVTFPLTTSDSISATQDSQRLLNATHQGIPPLLWIAKLKESDTTYMLVSIGLTETLDALCLDKEVGACPPLTSTIGISGNAAKDITLWIETSNPGIRYPIPISQVRYVNTVQQAQVRFTNVKLIVIPTSENRYRMVAVLSENLFGPYGIDRKVRCQQWRSSRDILSRVLRVVNGCH